MALGQAKKGPPGPYLPSASMEKNFQKRLSAGARLPQSSGTGPGTLLRQRSGQPDTLSPASSPLPWVE